MLLGIKNGVIVYASYKLNKGPADIPENELTSSEAERNTYWQGSVDKKLMPLAYFKQFKGVTIAGSVCIDAQEGVLGKYLKNNLQMSFPRMSLVPRCKLFLQVLWPCLFLKAVQKWILIKL